MRNYTLFIEARLSFVGFHAWPGAPAPVDYLRLRHRHVFGVRARREVTFADRQIEFQTFKKEIATFIERSWPGGELGETSCEAFATVLAHQFELDECEVSEDGENSGLIILSPEKTI